MTNFVTIQQWADSLEFAKLIDQGFNYGQAKKIQAQRKAIALKKSQ